MSSLAVGIRYLAELRITNLNIAELLDNKFSKSLLRKVRNIWTDANDLHFVKVKSLVEVTGDFPVPVDPTADIKEG